MDLMLYLLMLVIPLIAQIYVKVTYNKYNCLSNKKALSGYDVARQILDDNGLNSMYIVETKGVLTDHFDPKRKTIKLSTDVYNGTSISAIAIAAHECGHALQDKDNYFFLKIRGLIYPVVNLGTRFAYIVLLIGLVLERMNLVTLGIALVGLGLLFQLITLPVEFNASSRAIMELDKASIVLSEEKINAKKVLNSAALTYVAGVLSTALEMIRLLIIFGNDRD